MGFVTIVKSKKQQIKSRSKKPTKKKTTTLKLARTYISKNRTKVNNMVYNAMKKFSESKIIATAKFTNSNPLNIQPGDTTFWWGGCLGPNNIIDVPWAGDWNALGGISTFQGDRAQERTGNYIYLNKTHLTFQIDMRARNNEECSVQEFRVILFKTRRATSPVAKFPEPVRELFLDEIGNPFGHETVGKTGNDLMLQPLNKRQFVVFMDKRFLLSPQLVNNGQFEGYNSKYASYKRIPMNCFHKIKCRIPLPQDPGQPAFPSNYDYFYGVAIYARPVEPTTPADTWLVSARGSTTFMDS